MSFKKRAKPQKEFTENLLEVRRVTRVTTGGRRMSFRATILIGNGKGKVGVGVAKGPDVSGAVSKASREAYKNIVQVPITRANTVPYPITMKYKACRVKLMPASGGTGLKAGSSVRQVLELAWYENVLSKIIGSNNKLNNVLATINALTAYKHSDFFGGLLDKKVEKKEEKREEKKPTKKVPAKKEEKEEEKKEEKKVEEKKVEKKEEKKPAKKEAKKVEKKEEKKEEKKPAKKAAAKKEEKKAE